MPPTKSIAKKQSKRAPVPTPVPTPKPVKSKKPAPKKTKSSDGADRYVIIMAGGRGERFWPLSREATPKQLLRLLGDRSLLQQTVDRVSGLVPLSNIIVITNEAQLGEVRKQLPKLPKDNLIAEPVGRDTCAAVTLGAAMVGARSITGVMAVLPADHVIPDEKSFLVVLNDAFDLASRGQVIVTIGIKPTEPATGYGYIRTGIELPPPAGVKRYQTTFFKAEQFVEKPVYERAQEYLASGQYRWNAGMFVWSFVTITNGLEKHQPEMNAACHRWFEAAGKGKLMAVLKKEYPEIKRISIDFALMEHAQNVVVADGTFAWDDLGAWPALARHLKLDPEGNAAIGDFIHVDAARNVVFDARTKNQTPIAIVGLRDSVIVHTDDALLVAHKSQCQKIRELVRGMSQHPKYKHLV